MPDDRTRQLLRWLTAVDLPGTAVVACADARLPPIPADAVGVRLDGCVRESGIEFPAQLLACGIGDVQVVPCPADPRGTDELVGSWRAVLDGVAMAPAKPGTARRRGREGPVFDLARPLVPRRLAFGLRRRDGLPFDLDLDDTGRGVAALRILQREGRAHLPSPAAPREATEPGAPRGAVAFGLSASGCTACGVCVRACPAHALELASAAGVTVLRHHLDRCRADRSCVSLCPERALTVTERLTTVDLAALGTVDLARVETSVCGRCDAVHPAREGDLCRTCAFRASSAFGSRLPPGFSGR